MEIRTLINAATGNTTGDALRLDTRRQTLGAIVVHVFGTFTATGSIQGTIATQQEVDEGTAVWSTICGATWTQASVDALFIAPTHIRGVVSGWSAGTSITIKVLV